MKSRGPPMSLINLTVKHGRTREDACARLESVVVEVRAKVPPGMIRQVDWSAERDAVKVVGVGFQIDVRVDAQDVHLTGDVARLAGVLENPFGDVLKGIVGH